MTKKDLTNMLLNPPTDANGKIHGVGLVPGMIEISDRVKSVKAFLQHDFNQVYRAKGSGQEFYANEFVYDPVQNRMAVGLPRGVFGSPHQKLAQSIGVIDYSRLVGGMLYRTEDGGIKTNEQSGHFGHHWSEFPEVRKQFVNLVYEKTNIKPDHN